jgi:S1-C subfamily serine protease
MTPRRTTALVAAVAAASGAGGAALYGLADGGSATTTRVVTATAPAARPAAAVRSSGGLSVNQIYERTKAGVVDIKVRSSNTGAVPGQFGNPGGQESQAEGSGFVVDRSGHIVTNQHVVDGATSITVTFSDGHTASAKVVGTDPSTDVAVIKVDAPSSVL